MSRSVRILVATALVVAVVQAVSLSRRGARGQTDVGVFYRTCLLLAGGASGDLYTHHDIVTDWPISLTPAGLAIFQPLASFTPSGASLGWALINLSLVGVTIVVLRRFLAKTNGPTSDLLFAWAALIFVILSAGSIQVGQFSVLFVACWILALNAFADGADFGSGMLLAIPAAIKLYPALLLGVPTTLARTAGVTVRHLLGFLVGLIVFSLAIPSMAYGSRTVELNRSFWRNVILNPTGQVAYMQTVRASNQSLDALLLRYMTFDVEFHPEEPAMPHLDWPKQEVLRYANAARLIVFLITVVVIARWRTRHPTIRAHDILIMSALWSCTLYLMLPETKARYAVYTFLGFLPLLEVAVMESASTRVRRRAAAEIAIYVILIGGLMPDPPKVYGIGFVGALLLWLRNLRLVEADGLRALGSRARTRRASES